MNENGNGPAAGPVRGGNFTAHVAQRVARDGQAHADADGLFGADERFEHVIANLWVDAVALILDADFDGLGAAGELDGLGADRDGAFVGGFF